MPSKEDFPGFLSYGLLFDPVSLPFYESKGEAATHQTEDHARVPVSPRLLGALRVEEAGGGWSAGGGLWPGEKVSCCEVNAGRAGIRLSKQQT